MRVQKLRGSGELGKKMHSARESLLHVPGQNRFGRVVADAAGSPQEDHGGRDSSGEDHCIMSGAACHAMRSASGGADGRFDLGRQETVHGDGRLFEKDGVRDGEAATGGDFFGEMGELCDSLRASAIGGVADVESSPDFAGDDVCGTRTGLDGADGGDEPGCLPGFAFDDSHPLRSSGKSVAAQVHGSCTGMVGAAGEMELEAGLPDDGIDNGKGKTKILKDGTLLDMKFEES